MQETISEAVYEAMTQVNAVTDEDRATFQEIYGYHPDEAVEDDYDEDIYYGQGEGGGLGLGTGVQTRTAVNLGGEVFGDKADDNSDFTALICEALLTEGDVKQEQGRKVYAVVKKALDNYPKRVINGKSQNYFRGTPEEFADDLAEKITDGLESKGLVGKIAGFLKLRK